LRFEKEQSMKIKASGWLHMRLDTLLLLVTLATVAVAYYTAQNDRRKWHSTLNRVETACGLPPIQDVMKLEIAPMSKPNRFMSNASESRFEWMVWVPYGGAKVVGYTDQPMHDPLEAIGTKQIGFGRHKVAIVFKRRDQPTRLLVDGEELFSRKNDRSWNISLPASVSVGGSVQPPNDSSAVLFMALGHVRLEANEAYDASKHQFGLKVWLE
jgi:hypothetical protein